MEELNKNGHRHEKSFEVIERWRVDARNQGPRSRFGETLAALREEVGDNLKGNVLFATEDEAEDAVESFAYDSRYRPRYRFACRKRRSPPAGALLTAHYEAKPTKLKKSPGKPGLLLGGARR